MNYAGKFDGAISSDGPGNHSHFVHLNPGHIHAPADAIVVPDAHFLFNADFKRSGVDLVLSSDDHELVLHEYFKGEKHKALASPDGAHLTGELVDALTGHVELAQAGGATAAASAVIGHITKMQGSATVIRNGVSIILNMGDNVEKGDVVQSGSNSSVGITFIDGTVFGLSSNAKMVLNEMVYDPNGSNNSSLISLVAGTITFVAGETAKRGDMKIDTPVATMGIRGTAVLVEIDFSVPGANGAPNASFQVLVEPDGTTGSYILFDKATMQPLAIVNQAGQQININNGVISQTQNPLSPQMQQLINEVFSQKFTDNSTTKTTSPTGSSTPDGTTYLLKYADAAQQQTTTQGTGNNQQDKPAAPGGPGGQGTQHVPGAPIASFTSVQLFFIERPGLTGSSALDQMKFTVGFSDPNPGDTPTVRADFTGFTLKDAAGHDVPLSPLAQQDVLAAEIDLNPALVAAAGNANNGSTDVLYSLVDKDFDFLAQGQSITLSYVITVNNNYGPAPEVTKQTVTFTIFGTNDVPVIADDKLTQLIEFKGGTSTPGGTLTVLNGEATGGTYDFKDPDLTDTHWIIDANKDPAINHTADPNASDRFNSVHKAALTSASLTLLDGTTLDKAGLEALAPGPMSVFEQALDVNVSTDSTGTGNGEISWQLENLPVFLADFIPVGETLKLYYTIEVTDENGATDTKVVEVDITGTNAAATVWVHTTDDGHDGNWTTGANWGTGKAPTSVDDVIIVTDQLHPHTPAYPATITTGTNAAAHSVVMNDFVVDNTQPVPQTIPPELKLETGSSLTIGTDFDLSADFILTNAGTVTIDGKLELLDDATNPVTPVNNSVINNSGTINIGQGGDIQGLASITNVGTIDLQGGTLNLDVNVANTDGVTGGNINVDSGAKLVLGTDVNTGGVTGGTVTVKSGGELDLTGGNTLSGGKLTNQSDGKVDVTGASNVLDDVTVSNTGSASAIDITGALTLQDGTQVTNTDATSGERVDGGSLTLNGATISNGQITNEHGGILTLQANGRLDTGLTLTNTAQVDVTGASNVLDDVTVANTGSASAIDITGGLTLQDGTTLTNTDATSGETVDGGILTLNQATISNGQITNEHGGILTLQANGRLDTGLKLTNTAQVNVSGPGNVLDDVTVSNTGSASAIDIAGGLTLQDGTTLTNTNANSGETVDGGILTLNQATISNGQITNEHGGILTLQANGRLDTGLTLTNTAQVDVTGASNVLDYVTVSNTGSASAIDITGALTLQDGTQVTNTDATSGERVDGGSLTLNGATISNGQITNEHGGILTLQANGRLDTGLTLTNTAQVDVTGASNVLDDVTVSNTGSASAIDITGALTLQDGTQVTNTDATSGERVDGGSLTLNGATISNGQITNEHGGILTLQANGRLDTGLTLTNTAQVDVTGASNVLDDVTVANTGSASAIDITGGLTLQDGTTLTNTDATSGETVDGGILTLNQATISNGQITNEHGGILTLQANGRLDTGLKLTNTAQVNVSGPGNVLDDVTVSNTGSASAIDIAGGLRLQDGTTLTNTNANSGETVDGGILTLNQATISNGQITNEHGGILTLQANGRLDTGLTLTNTAQVDVTGASNVLDDVTVANTGSASAIDITGGLTLQDGTTLTNTDATSGETVDGGILTLNQATISNGQITNEHGGILTLQANGRLDTGLKLTNTAQVNVSGPGNVLDDVTVSNTGSASAIDIAGGLTLQDGTTLTNTNANSGETVDGGILTLNQATISNGQITNEHGGILTLQANGRLDTGLTLTNTAQVDVTGASNVLDYVTVSNTGSASAIDITGALTLQDGTQVTNTDATSGERVDGGSLTLNGATISNGQITNEHGGILTLQANGRLDTGLTLTNTAQVDVTGASNVLDDVTVSNTGSASAIDITGALTLQDGTTLINQNGTSGETIESGGSLTLNEATITGGMLTINGTLDSAGTSFITGAAINNTSHIYVVSGTLTIDPTGVTNTGTIEVENGATLVLDGETVGNSVTDAGVTADGTIQVDGNDTLHFEDSTINGGTLVVSGEFDSTGTSFITDATITNASHIDVVSGTLTIDPDGVTNTGTIEVEDSAKLVLNGETVANSVRDAGVTTDGTIQVDGNGLLDFEASTVTGGNINVEFSGKLVSTGDSFINGMTITNAGLFDVTDGTLTIDATSVLNNTGNLEADGGNLAVNAAVSGNLEIHGGSRIELGANVAGAYSAAMVTFDMGSTGTLKLDDAAASNGISIVGLDDDNTIDFTHLTYEFGLTVDYSGGTSGGVLSILDDGVEVTEIKLTGDYTGVHWVLGQDGGTGTTIVEAPGAIISGLDSHGNAVEDQTLTVAITDAGQVVTNATYTFETYNTVTHVWEVVQSGSNNTYTPDEQDEGKAFKVDLSFTDVNGDETSSVSAGTVQESPTENASISLSGLSSGNAVEGQQVTATVTEADAPASGITYTWKVNGVTVKTGVDTVGNTYTPTETDEGKAISVAVAFTDTHGFAESGSTSAGTVQESPTENASISLSGLSSGNAVEGQQVTATVTEADAPASGITYTWKVNGVTVKTGVDTAGNTYTPTETDEGKAISVAVAFTDTHGFAETGSTSAGTVQESPTENASIALSGLASANAVEGQQVTATVTEADAPASGITYTWKVNGVTVKTGVDTAGNTYTPTETDEGKAISVAVAFTDTHGFAESGSTSAGTVQESPTENASISLSGLSSGNAVEGQQVTATVTEADAPASGITYTWKVNGVTVKTGVDTAGNTYTPTETDEGKAISVAVAFTDTHGFAESGTKSAGTVQEQVGGDLAATLDHTTAQDGVTIHITKVTDGGIAVTTGLTYAWQQSTDGGQHWTTVGTAASFTPGDAQEGKLMQVVVTYADATGTESATYNLGTPIDLAVTLDGTTAQQGLPIHVTSVLDGGGAVSSGVSYAWQTSIDGGQHWITVGTNSNYTPVANDDNKLLQLVVTYADSGENESVTTSLGIVAAAKEWKGSAASPWDTAGQWTPSGVPGATDNAVVDTATGHSFTLSITQANDVAHSLVVNSNIAKVEIVNGGALTLSGNLTIDTGTFQIDAGGLLKEIATSSMITGSFTNNGMIEVGAGDKLEVASTSISGDGGFKIDAGATLQLDHALGLGNRVIFSGSGTLVLEDPAHFNGTVSDSTGSMTSGDVLDLIGFDTSATVAYSGNGSSGTVTVTEAGHTTANIKVGTNSTHWTTTPISDGHGGILIHDPPADDSSPTSDGQVVSGVSVNDPGPAGDLITIDHDGVSELAAGSVASITFADATGHLILDDASGSQIKVSGFAGDGTLAGSDQIDLKEIDHNSQTFAENFDAAKSLLTITDGNKSATLQFNGTYQAANFEFISDGHGGTIVYDPPVAIGAAQPNGFTLGQHGAAATSIGGDCFVFNLPGLQPLIQHAFEELQDTLAPLKDLLHIAEHPDVPAGTSAFGQQQHVAMGAAWIDSLKLLTPHTDLHV